VPLDQLSRHLLPLLKDNVKLVRMRVAHALLQIDKTKLNDEQLTLLKKVTDEYIEVQYTNSDVTAGLLNLGVYHYYNGNYNASEMFYNKAIETHPAFDGSYINLADLYRNQNREKEGIEVLQKGLKKASYSADIHHAMGLAKIRSNKKQESLGYLQEASKIAPQNSRYQYVYAIALNSLGKPKEAIKTLEDALKESPYDTDVLYTLVTLNIEQNDKTKALFYANKLTEYYPNNQNFKTLLQQIK
ncbi:MAG: tetratricopeptide repeat protein, partial [Bacteroidales bacterium]|nr:tetratricopeptide repeat protein [Bacteroidales bacterium]